MGGKKDKASYKADVEWSQKKEREYVIIKQLKINKSRSKNQ